MSKAPKYSNETTQRLLASFDRNVAEAKVALMKASEADLAVGWSLTMGEKVLMTMWRSVVVRQTINRLVHHSAQLTV
ncbi:MAG: hypothetical protein HOP12_03370 [Candidatus Eisenbacteria bacterium]|uniref:Uncharacterized protein n=1 Tax=Eiseniibacteriota bacterium TaxID=2212470 RepID=A0A849SP73_UNCEI|nr:hypothetical protein [Candidatus Eisenbacteria bacterium]